jgi:hypothetical protein
VSALRVTKPQALLDLGWSQSLVVQPQQGETFLRTLDSGLSDWKQALCELLLRPAQATALKFLIGNLRTV